MRGIKFRGKAIMSVDELLEGPGFKKIGELNMHCGECDLIDHCDEPFSEVIICAETRLKNIDIEIFYEYPEKAKGKTKQDRIDNAYERYKSDNPELFKGGIKSEKD